MVVLFIVFCTTYYGARAFGCFNVASIFADSSLEHDPISKLELDEAKEDAKLEPVEVYKEGMVVPPREDGRPPEPPEGFTIHTTESGVMVLRRKRQRNLQKLGKLKCLGLCTFFSFGSNQIVPLVILVWNL